MRADRRPARAPAVDDAIAGYGNIRRALMASLSMAEPIATRPEYPLGPHYFVTEFTGCHVFFTELSPKNFGIFSLVFDRTKGRCFSSELSQYASNDRFAKLDTHNCSERTLSRIAFMVRIRGRSG
jgi:hypothetical protein